MKELEGKIALVTGASSGIGLSTARLLALNGAKVYTAQRRRAKYNWIKADFSNASAAENVIKELSKEVDRLDILVNNAGIMKEGTVEETTLNDWNSQLTINLTTPFLLIKFGLKLLQKKGASIVNVGSIEGIGSNPGHSAYCASKAGLHALTRAVAVDYGSDGIRCNAVAPGWIDTPLNTEYIKSFKNPEEFENRIGDIHPLMRIGSSKEIAELIFWLSSERASFVTGQVFTIDGGRTAKLSLP